MKYYFNWSQLLKASSSKNNAIIILAYGLTRGYNKTIANDGKELMNKLHINSVPLSLFQKHKLSLNHFDDIICKFKCEEPQSYFINKSFLFNRCHAVYKANYLYALSLRNIATTEPRIPKSYLEESKWENPLLEIDGEYIKFLPELRLLMEENKKTWLHGVKQKEKLSEIENK